MNNSILFQKGNALSSKYGLLRTRRHVRRPWVWTWASGMIMIRKMSEHPPFDPRRFAVPALVACLLLSATAWAADAPATQPADAPELIHNKSEMIGYGAEKARLVNEKDEIISILGNGATVIVKRIPSPAVAVRGYCLTGGVYEGRWLGGGLSHLLEHLVAGGSNARRTEQQNKELLQRIGNDSNAYTTDDHTAYFVNTTTDHMEEAVDLVTGWMTGAQITFPEYRREYQVVQRELERGKGMPDLVFWYLYSMNRYHVSPMRVPTIGYQEVIQGLSRDDVYSYYEEAYQPGNMVFVVVGDIDPEQMLDAMRKNLSDVKPGRVFSHNIPPEPPVLAPRTLVATFPQLGTARVDLSFPSVRETSMDMYPLDLLAQIMGGGESSVLVQDLRDTRQLVSVVGCSDETPSFVDGSFQVDLECDADKIQPAIAAILSDLAVVRDKGVDEDRLARAKTQMKMARLKQLQTSEDVAASLAIDYFSTGDAHFSDRYVDRVEAVTAAQIQAAARKYLDEGKLVTTALLPSEAVGSEGLPKAVDLLRPAAPAGGTGPTQEAAAGPQEVQRFVLDNGTVLLFKRFTTTPLVSVRMYAVGGVTDEDAATNGLGNLTMSMLARGTATRSAAQIAEYFDSIGGEVGASCGNNTFSWSMGCSKENLPAAMAVYADMILHPSFPDSELAEMKQRVAASIAGQDAEWHDRAFRFFKKEFFGPGNEPYQFMPIGTIQNVKVFTADQMKQWYAEKVLTAPRVLAIFGDVSTDQAKQLAQSLLGGGEKVPAPQSHPFPTAAAPPPAATPFINVSAVKVEKVDQGPASVVIGFHSASIIGEPSEGIATRAYTLAAGFGYPTGYIFETLRGLGLSYEAAAYDNPGRSDQLPGCMMAYAACDAGKVNQVTDLILLNMARLQGTDADMQPDWFNRSKELISTADALEHETTAQQAERDALDELLGLGYDYHLHLNQEMSTVTLDDVRAYAATRLRDCIVTICTPDPDSVKVAAGRREYTSFPVVDLTPKGIQLDTGAPR
jgi:zinc protease